MRTISTLINLSSLLFNIYTYLLSEITWKLRVRCYHYAIQSYLYCLLPNRFWIYRWWTCQEAHSTIRLCDQLRPYLNLSELPIPKLHLSLNSGIVAIWGTSWRHLISRKYGGQVNNQCMFLRSHQACIKKIKNKKHHKGFKLEYFKEHFFCHESIHYWDLQEKHSLKSFRNLFLSTQTGSFCHILGHGMHLAFLCC